MTHHSTVALPGNPNMSQYYVVRNLGTHFDSEIFRALNEIMNVQYHRRQKRRF
jgi:hypothetical protein